MDPQPTATTEAQPARTQQQLISGKLFALLFSIS
jgi:hypothetical protein